MKSDLYFVPSGTKIDLMVYTTEILDSLLIPFWYQTCEEYVWTWVVEDGMRGHKKWAIVCGRRNNMEVID